MEQFNSVEEVDQTSVTIRQKNIDTATKSVPISTKDACSASLLHVAIEASSTQPPDVVDTFIEQLHERAILSHSSYNILSRRIENFRAQPRPDGRRARKSAMLTLMEGKYMLKGFCTVLNQAAIDNRNNVLYRNKVAIMEEIELLKAADKRTVDGYTDLVGRRQRLLYAIESDLISWEQQPFIRAKKFLELGLQNLKLSGGDPEAVNLIADKGREGLNPIVIVHPPLILEIFDEIAEIMPETVGSLDGEDAEDNNPVEHQHQSHLTLLAEAKEEEQKARKEVQKAHEKAQKAYEEVQKARDRLALAVKRCTEIEQECATLDLEKSETVQNNQSEALHMLDEDDDRDLTVKGCKAVE